MDYFDLNNHLKEIFTLEQETIHSDELNISIHNYPFNSSSTIDSNEFGFDLLDGNGAEDNIFSKDIEVKENTTFKYIIVKKRNTKRAKDVIFLFHGLNERHWQKYLPWAINLHQLTEKAVILFPIAFHMNRAPRNWSDPRIMNKISSRRVNAYKNIKNSTFANAALSERLHHNPSRFFTSGFHYIFVYR